MSKRKTRVVVAEDNDVVRRGIKNLLTATRDIEVVGEARNGVEALELVDELFPDVLVLDIEMPLRNGFSVARELKRTGNPVRVLVLSAYNDTGYMQEMLANGASGYLVKGEAPGRIVAAVRAAGDRKGVSSRRSKIKRKS
jgi:two-component system, NarL family, response regulator DesR